MNKLKEYLYAAKQFNTPIRALVMGNPSADMDSVVGSIILSYVLGA